MGSRRSEKRRGDGQRTARRSDDGGHDVADGRVRRSTWDGQIVVYRYGCPAKADLDAAGLAQLRLAHELRNELVAIHRRYEDVVAAAWATCPEVAEISAEVGQKEEALAAILERVRASKAQGRTQAVPAELREAAVQARRELSASKEARRLTKNKAFDELKDVFAAARDQLTSERKATYATWVQRDGLYWATYGDVVSHFDASVAAVARLRRDGRSASLRFHRFDGSGTLTVQLHREAADGPRTPAALASGVSKWRNVVRLPPMPEGWKQMDRREKKQASRATILMRTGRTESGGPRWLAVPTILHRPIPHDADIAQVQVTRRRVAGQYRLSIGITCRLPAPETPVRPKPTVAVDVGWRSLADGRIRVAMFEATASPGPITVPHHVRDMILLGAGGRQGEVVLPASWTAPFLQLRSVSAVRARNLEQIRGRIAAWLTGHPSACEALDVDSSVLANWRSPRQFAALALRWRDHRVDDDDVFGEMETWRRRDRRLWEWQEHQRRQLIDRRRDAWRVLGALLADNFATIVVHDIHIAYFSRIPPAETGGEQRDSLARAQRVLAAPGSLREAVAHAAERRGVKVLVVDGPGVTKIHHRCGHDLSGHVDFAAGVWAFCKHCDESFDQDINACQRLLEMHNA